MSTLDEISYLSPSDSLITSRLRSIASSTLCVSFHQNQSESVLSKWQQTIKQLNPKVTEQAYTPPLSSRYPRSGSSQAESDLKAQLQEMEERIADIKQQIGEHQTRDRGRNPESTSQTRSRQQEEHRRNAQKQREQEATQKEDERRERAEKERRERAEKKRTARAEEERRGRAEEERREKAKKERRERAEEQERRKEEEEARERRRKTMEDEARREKERQEKAQADHEQNERTRKKAQNFRDERARAKAAKQKEEREEWNEAWQTYQNRWAVFRTSTCREGNVREAIPSPVKSGRHSDVETSSVKEFMQLATPRDADVVKLMRKECLKWHPDKVTQWVRSSELSVEDRELIDTICRVVTGLLNSKAGKASEFL